MIDKIMKTLKHRTTNRYPLVSYQVAKLAKEIGFKEPCYCYYNRFGELKESFITNGSSTDIEITAYFSDLLKDYNTSDEYNYFTWCSAPTQSQLQQWLRDKFEIFVYVLSYKEQQTDYNDFIQFKHNLNNNRFYKWEEALEDGLLEGLKMI